MHVTEREKERKKERQGGPKREKECFWSVSTSQKHMKMYLEEWPGKYLSEEKYPSAQLGC